MAHLQISLKKFGDDPETGNLHNGIDIAASKDAPVYAADGTVKYADANDVDPEPYYNEVVNK